MGRPKGSKNKPKNVVVEIPKSDYFVVSSDLGDGDVPSAPAQTPAPVQKKRGRPKGSKNKPKVSPTPTPVVSEPEENREETSDDIPMINSFGRDITRYDIGRKHNPGMDIVTCPVCGRNALRQEVFSLDMKSSRTEFIHIMEKAAMFNQYLDFCDDRGPHVCN